MDRAEELEVVERLMARDERALREVMQHYGGLVRAMARRVVAEPGLADEAAQDTFMALWRRPGAFDPDRGRLQTFLLGVARNKAVDLVRKEASARRLSDVLISEAEATSTELTTDEPTVEMEDRQELKAALAQLSGAQREALVLAYFGGRTYREVAVELGIPEGTAKTRLRDGLNKLRQVMSRPEGREL